MSPDVLHVDMDAFFASIEQRDHPRLRGRPIVVGGSPDGRGVVSSPSYEARPFGIRSAQPAAEARRLCPQAIFVRPRMDVYVRQSRAIRSFLETFSPDVEMMSLDEATIGIRGLERLHGGPETLGTSLRRAIRERFDLPASVGISIAKVYAKMASEQAKPDGLCVVPAAALPAFLDPLPVGSVPGIGPKMQERLASLGVRIFRDLHAWSRPSLEASLGEVGCWLHDVARGRAGRGRILRGEAVRSRGTEETFERDRVEPEFLRSRLLAYAEEIARSLREDGLRGRTVTLKTRSPDFRTTTRSRSLPVATDLATDLHPVAMALLTAAPPGPYRLLGLTVSGLHPATEGHALFEEVERERRLARSADEARDRFGEDAVRPAALLPRPGREARRQRSGRVGDPGVGEEPTA